MRRVLRFWFFSSCLSASIWQRLAWISLMSASLFVAYLWAMCPPEGV